MTTSWDCPSGRVAAVDDPMLLALRQLLRHLVSSTLRLPTSLQSHQLQTTRTCLATGHHRWSAPPTGSLVRVTAHVHGVVFAHIADAHDEVDTMTLDDDHLALVLATKDTDVIHT